MKMEARQPWTFLANKAGRPTLRFRSKHWKRRLRVASSNVRRGKREMGKERDKLIRRYGGVPVSEERLSDAELMRRYMESYARQGRLPPEIEALHKERKHA